MKQTILDGTLEDIDGFEAWQVGPNEVFFRLHTATGDKRLVATQEDATQLTMDLLEAHPEWRCAVSAGSDAGKVSED